MHLSFSQQFFNIIWLDPIFFIDLEQKNLFI